MQINTADDDDGYLYRNSSSSSGLVQKCSCVPIVSRREDQVVYSQKLNVPILTVKGKGKEKQERAKRLADADKHTHTHTSSISSSKLGAGRN